MTPLPKIVDLEDWNREAERYQLTEVAPGGFVYRLKSGMERGEPPHDLCTNCFTKREKSILQSDPPGMKRTTHRCPRCKNILVVPNTDRPMEEEGEPDIVPGFDEYEY